MAVRIGRDGSEGFGGDDRGDRKRSLPPQYDSERLAPSPYRGFPHPMPFDAVRGHNIPLMSPDPVRIALLEIIDIRYDYLICKGYEPETGDDLEEVAVAKPYLLQRTPFDGETVQLRDMEVTYEYQEQEGLRIARAIIPGDEEDEEIEETQRITEDYVLGDILAAMRARFGKRPDATEWEDEDGEPIEWIDLNFSGRAWAVTDEEVG